MVASYVNSQKTDSNSKTRTSVLIQNGYSEELFKVAHRLSTLDKNRITEEA